MIHVIATIQVQPRQQAAFLDVFRGLVPTVRQEAGCLEYGPTLDFDAGVERQLATRSDVVTVVERWESVAALQAHLASEHMQKFREQAGPMIAGVEIRTLRPAE